MVTRKKKTIKDMVMTLGRTLAGAIEDAEALDEKGNKAAARRVRNALLSVKNGCHDLRKEISARVG